MSGTPATTWNGDRRCGPDPTEGELECLRLAAAGLTATQIGRALGVSERTARRRLAELCDTFDTATVIEAVVVAVRLDLL